MASLAARRLTPERLDDLPPSDPAARASRRDLRRINALMAQGKIGADLVRAHAATPPRRIADLGCGDGTGALRLLRRLGRAPEGGTLVLTDRQPVVTSAALDPLAALGWQVDVVAADVFDYLDAGGRHDLIVTNLFLHHFEGPELTRLLHAVAGASDLFVATEPLRSRLALWPSALLGLIGANGVTRHDARVSVEAGFRGQEMSDLWPGTPLAEGRRGAFTQGFAGRGLHG
ncbi:methyltransferase domain-containing protein [Pseudoroseicyclus aestuarii]|uniref:Methyltransferase family protein n=1 Tax=Pseudoroseicyclus aestuarii TaxID=1795041 RepID=A0A318STN5_9RHOB|nr:methyltransferase domain-containing protein [Pseudoroseicyclus aestuarii]PYE84822.1 methyltransferase family protein [Pseudoroseicyclus aestuarii]